MKEELHSRDKVVQKMSRDGLTEVNVTQDTVKRISMRTEEHSYDKSSGKGEKFHSSGSTTKKQTSWEWQKKTTAQRTTRAEAKEKRQEERIEKVERRAVRARRKSDKRYRKTPKKHRLHFKNEFVIDYKKFGPAGPVRSDKQMLVNPEDYKLVRRLRFEKEMKAYRYKIPKVRRAVIRKGEHKLFEDEDDNLGLEASHKGYRVGRSVYRWGRRKWKKHNSKQNKYYRADSKTTKLDNKLTRLKFYQENPDMKRSEQIKQKLKEFQKKYQQKAYAKQAREKEAAAMQKVRQGAQAAAKKLAELFQKNAALLLKLGGGLLLVLLLMAGGASLIAVISEVGSAILGGTYQADYGDLTDCDSAFKEQEAMLQDRLDHIEDEFPGYDEYDYHLGKIGHDATMLLSYLGAKFGDINFDGAAAEIDSIFEEMYNLIIEEEIQIRTRWEEEWSEELGKFISKEVQYEYKILHVYLQVKDLQEIVDGRLTADEKKQYEIYMETGGGQQVFGNPFDFDWHEKISSPFGYRVHPITGDLKLHTGVDIAAPEGTPIHSAMTGTVVSAGWSDSYGWNVVVESGTGMRSKYAHCSKLLVAQGDRVTDGDVLAEVGSTGNSTGNHLHLEFISPDGQFLNPLFMTSNYEKKESEDG